MQKIDAQPFRLGDHGLCPNPEIFPVKYAALFLILGLLLAFLGLSGYLGLIALWPAGCCIAVSISYLFGSPAIFGKQQSGQINFLSAVLLFPYLALTWFGWHLVLSLIHI